MILVTGGSGQLGTAFRRLLPDAVFPARSEFDLSEPESIPGVLDRLRPTTIINCAAYTAVDRAESEPDVAMDVNGHSVGALARWAGRNGARLATFSTDYVFDGVSLDPYVESSPTHPLNVYGASKLLGERLAAESDAGALVVRTAWLLSTTHPNFVSKILERARRGPVQVVTDQTGCPTFVDDLARASAALLDGGATGLCHVVNSGSATWFDLAVAAVTAAGLDPALVEPTTSDSFPTEARRPAHSVLASERSDVAATPHWRDRIGDLVSRISAEGPGS
jgi:dTDP-4-dehydrorhamnose reductase